MQGTNAGGPILSQRLRVLLALHAPESRTGSVPPRVRELQHALTVADVDADVSTADAPDASGYDLVHAFNVWEPSAALAQLRHLRGFATPVVFSPSYIELSEFAWAARAVPQIFDGVVSAPDREAYLRAAADGSLVADGVARCARNEIVPGYFARLNDMLGLVDHVIGASETEIEQLWATGAARAPFTIARDGVDAARFAAASPQPFAHRFGVGDYVLCVGAIEPRRNQLLLAHALRDTGVALVLMGVRADAQYAAAVARVGGPNVRVVDDTAAIADADLVASAYAGARVVVLASWCEAGALGPLEAAAAGAPLVLSDRGAAKEYFGELARYCDPADVVSIRAAVLDACAAPPDAARRTALRAHAARHTWAAAARATLEGYAAARAQVAPRTMTARADVGTRTSTNHANASATRPTRAAAATSAPPSHANAGRVGAAPRKLEIGSGTDPQPGYEHLDSRPDLPCLEHVHDIQAPLRFADHTFDEILSRSCLEHVSWRVVTGILRDWHRVLKPGGTLRVYVPDFEYLCRMYLAGKSDEHLHPSYIDAANTLLGGYTPNAWAMIKMFGGQEYPANFHAAGYDFATFARILQSAGFEQVTRVPPAHGLYVVAHRPLADPLTVRGRHQQDALQLAR